MRDLYEQINLPRNSSIEYIKSYLSSIKSSSLKRDVETVLLNSNRKRQYDELNNFLHVIGKLRGEMGLQFAESWTGDESVSYFYDSRSTKNAEQIFKEKLNTIKHNYKQRSAKKDRNKLIVIFSIIAIIIFLIIVNKTNKHEPDNNSINPTNIQSTKSQLPVLPNPKHGEIINNLSDEPIAPLQIKTSSSINYFVKLTNLNNYKTMTVFIHGGKTLTINVPLGYYSIKYASGENWYGYNDLFGEEGSYAEADENFNFYISNNQISGYEITLYGISNGNLRTRSIDFQNF